MNKKIVNHAVVKSLWQDLGIYLPLQGKDMKQSDMWSRDVKGYRCDI
jgi:hypothetical protein